MSQTNKIVALNRSYPKNPISRVIQQEKRVNFSRQSNKHPGVASDVRLSILSDDNEEPQQLHSSYERYRTSRPELEPNEMKSCLSLRNANSISRRNNTSNSISHSMSIKQTYKHHSRVQLL
mmetsp:Transcript_15318/g.13395  ORF Transcript_15318/g.13395 Transcript_15318/m.13395 type:complete len:121 (+) Transcript_15318:351-713(+)